MSQPDGDAEPSAPSAAGTRRRSSSAWGRPPPAKRRKGGRGRGRGKPAEEEETVVLGERIERDSERLRVGPRPVRLSQEDKAAAVAVDEGGLVASHSGGYSMVRATHGTHEGAWYYEATVEALPPGAAVRVGWSTRRGELLMGAGADEHSYSYASKEGCKVHHGLREPYGRPFGAGDVIGCLLSLPLGGRPIEKSAADVVRYKASAYFLPNGPAQAEPRPLPGASVSFTLNGQPQGTAYVDVPEGTYYPALSLYTPAGSAPARLRANFGAAPWAHPPPAVALAGCGGVQLLPVSELSGEPEPDPEEEGGAAEAAVAGEGGATEAAVAEEGGAAEAALAGEGGAAEAAVAGEGGATEVAVAEEGGATEAAVAEEGGAGAAGRGAAEEAAVPAAEAGAVAEASTAAEAPVAVGATAAAAGAAQEVPGAAAADGSTAGMAAPGAIAAAAGGAGAASAGGS